MKISLLKNQNYLVMPWKNGRGFTSEIAIFPKQSSLIKNDFSWRLSSAEVAEKGPFSSFPGCDRYLAIIEGHGLKLQFENENKLIDQNSCLKFSGEEKVFSELVNGKIKDLNLIVKKNSCDIRFEILSKAVTGLTKGTSVIFVIEGSVTVENHLAEKFDTVLVETEQDENHIRILPAQDSKFALITIS